MTKQEIDLLIQKIDLLEKKFEYLLKLEFEDDLKSLKNEEQLYKQVNSIVFQRKRLAKHTGTQEEFNLWKKEALVKYSEKIGNYSKRRV